MNKNGRFSARCHGYTEDYLMLVTPLEQVHLSTFSHFVCLYSFRFQRKSALCRVS